MYLYVGLCAPYRHLQWKCELLHVVPVIYGVLFILFYFFKWESMVTPCVCMVVSLIVFSVLVCVFYLEGLIQIPQRFVEFAVWLLVVNLY